MNLLSDLPDEIYRIILKYQYSEVLHQLEYGGGVPVYPIDFYYCFCAENSDYVRSRYLQSKWKDDIKDRRGSSTLRLRDWWKLLMDLERPTVWTSAVHGWKLYSVRRWQVESGGITRGGLYWNSTYEQAHLSLPGWDRLSSNLSMDAHDARVRRLNYDPYYTGTYRVIPAGKRVSNLWFGEGSNLPPHETHHNLHLCVNGYTERTGFF